MHPGSASTVGILGLSVVAVSMQQGSSQQRLFWRYHAASILLLLLLPPPPHTPSPLPLGTMEGGRQTEVSKAILSRKDVPYVVAAPLLIQVCVCVCVAWMCVVHSFQLALGSVGQHHCSYRCVCVCVCVCGMDVWYTHFSLH
jgi:hypothetical protein